MEQESTNHLLFLCPFAGQVWNLVPTELDQRCFPSEALFTNMDTLFWRLKANVMETDQVRSFPWILWMIWKARNDLVFNGGSKLPEEVLINAVRESKAWFEANNQSLVAVPADPRVDSLQAVTPAPPSNTTVCKTDAAWKESDPFCGLGWCIFDAGNKLVYIGLRGTRRCLSALHAELQSLVWECSACWT